MKKEIMQYGLSLLLCFNYVMCMWKKRTGESY